MHQLKKHIKLPNTIIWILLLFCTVTQISHAGQYDRYVVGTVTKVRDGDTIVVRVANTDEILQIRLYGINAPEKTNPPTPSQKNSSNKKIADKLVEIYNPGIDHLPPYLLTNSQAWTC